MAISFVFDGDDVVWTQRFERPAVYLDTFAIREIADSDELSVRFAEALKGRNATWLIATLCMGEFARLTDPRHAERAEQLLAQVVPHIYLFLSESDDKRIKRGETDLATRSLPRADERNLDYFSRRWAKEQSLPDTFRGMFQPVHEHRDRMKAVLDDIASKLATTLVHLREQDVFRSNAKTARPDGLRTRQQIIAGDLLRELVLDPKAPISDNEALDLMHAVDAVDYCDLVLLDKAWERRVNALHQRIVEAGITMPVATCYSKSKGGVERFLEALEQWPEQSDRG